MDTPTPFPTPHNLIYTLIFCINILFKVCTFNGDDNSYFSDFQFTFQWPKIKHSSIDKKNMKKVKKVFFI